MRMVLPACALALLTSVAFADDWTKEETEAGLKKIETTRHVPSGKQRALTFLAYLNPDCTVVDGMDIKKTKEPEHGMVEVIADDGFVSYVAGSIRAKCNEKKVKGLTLTYKSALQYKGPDSFEVLELTPSGFARQTTFKVIVH
jgi:hypothetical protein